MTEPTANTITFDTGIGWGGSLEYRKDTSQTTSDAVFYELYTIGGGAADVRHGIKIANESGVTKVYAETDGNSLEPFTLSVNSGTESSSVQIANTNVLKGFTTSSGIKWQFTIDSTMLWTSGINLHSSSNTGSIVYEVTNSTITLTIDSNSESDGTIDYKVTWLNGTVVNVYGPYGHTLGNVDSYDITSNDPLNGTWSLITNDGSTTTVLDTVVIGGGGPTSSSGKKVHCNFW